MSGALFAAWRPGGPGRERLARLVAGVLEARPADAPRLRPVRPDQLHLTLCFAGRDRLEQVDARVLAALAAVAGRTPPLALHLAAIEHWPAAGVVVAVAAPCPALQALCDATCAALHAAGLPPARPTTRPHVTLARLGRREAPQEWPALAPCDPAPLRMASMELLHNPGGGYAALGRWPLTGAPDAPGP